MSVNLFIKSAARKLAALAMMFGICTTAQAALTVYTDVSTWAGAMTQSTSSVDFDDLPDVTALANQYAGVGFSAINSGNPLVVNYSFAQTGLNMVSLGTPPLTGGGGGVAMALAVAAQGVGFWYLDSEFADNNVMVFNGSGQELGHFEMAFPHPAEWQFVGFIDSEKSIRRIDVTIGAADFVALDSLQFSAPAMDLPGPPTMSLLLAALLASLVASGSAARSFCTAGFQSRTPMCR